MPVVARGDGARVLVDRIWPRGLTKAKADLDEWCKQVAHRRSFASGTAMTRSASRSSTRRYRVELKQSERSGALTHLRGTGERSDVDLAHRDQSPEISEAAVLAEMLRR